MQDYCPSRRVSLVKREIEMQTPRDIVTDYMEIDNLKADKEGFEKQQHKDPWNLEERREDWEEEPKKN